jgi:hypothetical protein
MSRITTHLTISAPAENVWETFIGVQYAMAARDHRTQTHSSVAHR